MTVTQPFTREAIYV